MMMWLFLSLLLLLSLTLFLSAVGDDVVVAFVFVIVVVVVVIPYLAVRLTSISADRNHFQRLYLQHPLRKFVDIIFVEEDILHGGKRLYPWRDVIEIAARAIDCWWIPFLGGKGRKRVI